MVGTYEYDAAGQRTQKTASGAVTKYHYNGNDLLYTTDASGATLESNILEPDGSIICSTRGNTDEKYWYRLDMRGGVTNIVDQNDALKKSYTYGAYGNTEESGTLQNSFAYTGAVWDAETKLYYMNARYYVPETGRFLTEDSYRGDGETFWHLYSYCEGDPVNYTDPTGHIPNVGPGSWTGYTTYYDNTINQYVKIYIWTPYSVQTFNCYSFAMRWADGVHNMDKGYNPGNIGGYAYGENGGYSMTTMRTFLEADCKKMGYTCTKVSGPKNKFTYNDKTKKGYWTIAMRVSKKDYHFMKDNENGYWNFKISNGSSPILFVRGRRTPSQIPWSSYVIGVKSFNDKKKVRTMGVWVAQLYYYTSQIYYFRINKNGRSKLPCDVLKK